MVGITALNFVFFTVYLFFFPTLPFFIEKLGGAKSEVGVLIGVSSLTSLFVRPFVGYLVDSVGRKPLVVAGLVLFSVNALVYNLTPTPMSILPVRVLTGASLATFVTAASTYVADAVPADRRSQALGYYGVANSLAFAVGPALGGIIIHTSALDGLDSFLTGGAGWLSGAKTGELHFTTLFLVAAIVSAVCALFALRLPPDMPSAGAAHPRLRPNELFARAAGFAAAVNFTSSFVFAAMVSFMPLFARDLGMENPGVLFMVYAAALIALRIAVGRVTDSVPRAAFIVPGVLCLAAAMVVLLAATTVPMLFLAAALYGVGAGAFQPALMAYVIDRVQPAERGRALSTFTIGNDLGLSLGSFFLGFVIDASGFRSAFAIAAVIAVIGAAMFFGSYLRERRGTAAMS